MGPNEGVLPSTRGMRWSNGRGNGNSLAFCSLKTSTKSRYSSGISAMSGGLIVSSSKDSATMTFDMIGLLISLLFGLKVLLSQSIWGRTVSRNGIPRMS